MNERDRYFADNALPRAEERVVQELINRITSPEAIRIWDDGTIYENNKEGMIEFSLVVLIDPATGEVGEVNNVDKYWDDRQRHGKIPLKLFRAYQKLQNMGESLSAIPNGYFGRVIADEDDFQNLGRDVQNTVRSAIRILNSTPKVN